MSKARVLLADDHTIVAEGLKSLLEDEFELVATVGDGRALIEAAERLEPDVIVTDISMPTMNGLEAIRELRRAGFKTYVVVLTMHSDERLVSEAFRAGACGYLLKQSAGEELISAIHDALAGRRYLTPLIEKDLVELAGKAGDPALAMPTPRQREVLRLIAEGRTMKEVAAALQISTRTAESHKYDMMRELGVETTAELIQFAVKIGLIAP